MYEVYIRLSFDEPCLGNERGADNEPSRMRYNSEGTVIFQQSWWRSMVISAVDGYNKHQHETGKILWTPEIDGTPGTYKRHYTIVEDGKRVRKYKLHESFNRGEVIGVKALVPDGIPVEDLRELMQLAGTYYGISPYGWSKGYGKFRVVELSKVYNRRSDGKANDKAADEGEPTMDNPCDKRDTESS